MTLYDEIEKKAKAEGLVFGLVLSNGADFEMRTD
jgi:hypothetical protein